MSEVFYSPWVHPVGRAAIIARRTALYGFRQHEAIALLGDVTAPCTTCGGTGLLGTYGAIGWHICPTCHGLGEAYTVSMDELEALRQKALKSYPDAGEPDWRPDMGQLISGIARRCDVQGELPFSDAGGGYPLFLPVERCVGALPPQPTPSPKIKPNFSWAGLRVLLKTVWRKRYAEG